jgi:hypothetical protein
MTARSWDDLAGGSAKNLAMLSRDDQSTTVLHAKSPRQAELVTVLIG